MRPKQLPQKYLISYWQIADWDSWDGWHERSCRHDGGRSLTVTILRSLQNSFRTLFNRFFMVYMSANTDPLVYTRDGETVGTVDFRGTWSEDCPIGRKGDNPPISGIQKVWSTSTIEGPKMVTRLYRAKLLGTLIKVLIGHLN